LFIGSYSYNFCGAAGTVISFLFPVSLRRFIVLEHIACFSA